MFYACIPLFSYMGTNLGQMLSAAALRLLPAARISNCRPGYSPDLHSSKRKTKKKEKGYFFYKRDLLLFFTKTIKIYEKTCKNQAIKTFINNHVRGICCVGEYYRVGTKKTTESKRM